MKQHKEFDCFIFTHIPKCGGSSFRKYIYDTAINSNITSQEVHIPGEGNLANTKNIPNLTKHELSKLQNKSTKIIADHSKFNVHREYEIKKISKPFYFTMLRDPVERFISHYYFFYFKLGYNNLKNVHLNDLSKEQLEKLSNTLENIQVNFICNNKIKRPITHLDCNRAMGILANRYHCFGILEQTETSIQLLQKMKPKWLSMKTSFPKSNVNSKKKNFNLNNEIIEQIKIATRFDEILYSHAQNLFELRAKLFLGK